MTCEIAARRAYDHVANLLSADERVVLDAHLRTCGRCADLMAQLHDTVSTLRSRHPLGDALDDLAAVAARERGSDLAGHLPQLYALAVSLDPSTADDLVQETLSRALEDPTSFTDEGSFVATLTELAGQARPVLESPSTPQPGEDPDADGAELFYPSFYGDAPDPGSWVNPVVAWGEDRSLPPDDDLITAELLGVVDGTLAELDPTDQRLLSLVDIDGVPFGQAVMILDLDRRAAHARLARARRAMRRAVTTYLQTASEAHIAPSAPRLHRTPPPHSEETDHGHDRDADASGRHHRQ